MVKKAENDANPFGHGPRYEVVAQMVKESKDRSKRRAIVRKKTKKVGRRKTKNSHGNRG